MRVHLSRSQPHATIVTTALFCAEPWDQRAVTQIEATWLQRDKIKILLLEGISDTAVAALDGSGYRNVQRLPKALDAASLQGALDGVHLLGIRSRTQLTEEIIAGADSLIAIGCF